MTTYYFLNTLGRPKLTDKQMEQIPSPFFELYTHVTMKTVQAFGFLGAGVVGPAVSVCKGNRDFKSIQDSAYIYGKKGLILGAVLGPALTTAKAISMSREGAYDRAYRLRYSKQTFVDRISIFGTLVGLSTAQFLGEELGRGALFGFTGGFFVATLVNVMF